MKQLIPSLALLTAIVGCESSGSRLDKVTSKVKDKGAEAATQPSTAAKMDRSGTIEQRLARLEDTFDRNAEQLAFLDQAYEQTMEQQTKPTPDGIYAVDIAPNIALGQVEGSPNALVTIVEAWDFA